MARQKAGEKAYRTLDLLTGLYDLCIQRLLAPHGLNDEELERGWDLLREFAKARHAAGPPADSADFLRQLDQWENKWFVVCEAALARPFPKVKDWLFNKLPRTSGLDLMLTVSTFLERVRKLEKGAPAPAKDAKLAREYLRKRGLTAAALQEAEALLKQLVTLAPVDVDPREVRKKEVEAEAALWAWYLEWSGVARAVLTEKRHLNHIGFGKVGRPRKGKGKSKVKGREA